MLTIPLHLQEQATIDTAELDSRIWELQDRLDGRLSHKKWLPLKLDLSTFLQRLPEPRTVTTCSVSEVLRFLAYKDQSGLGKTQVHDFECESVGGKGLYDCGCPRRMSANGIRNIISGLKKILNQAGRCEPWDEGHHLGNPACSEEVRGYYLAMEEEQAEAHVAIKQTPPLLPKKLSRLCSFLVRESKKVHISLKERFLLLRDRAMFSIQFFAGGRGLDLTKLRQNSWVRKYISWRTIMAWFSDKPSGKLELRKSLQLDATLSLMFVLCNPQKTIPPSPRHVALTYLRAIYLGNLTPNEILQHRLCPKRH